MLVELGSTFVLWFINCIDTIEYRLLGVWEKKQEGAGTVECLSGRCRLGKMSEIYVIYLKHVTPCCILSHDLSNLGSFITGFGYGSGCTSLTTLTVSGWVDEVGIQRVYPPRDFYI